MYARSLARSSLVYSCIDGSNGYYLNRVNQKYRSRVSIVFRIQSNAQLEEKFINAASAVGFSNLKSHASAGGIRVNMGNGQSFAAVYALVAFMETFKRENQV